MEDVYKQYAAFSKEAEARIIQWARPEWFGTNGQPTFVPPTKSWPLTSFESALAISVGYLAFVLVGSMVMRMGVPKLITAGSPSAEEVAAMKKANPVLKFARMIVSAVRFVYNPVQIMLCSYMSVEALMIARRSGYTMMPCVPYNAAAPPMGELLWIFYLSKVLDFFDTFFIIVGKKWDQLSFLHVYHHWSIFLFYWFNVNVAYDGDVYLTVMLNGFIHFVMYTYYFIKVHPGAKVWWKEALTSCQLIQFVCMMSQASYLLATDCKEMPTGVVKPYLLYIMSMFGLFMQFFLRSYVFKPAAKAKGKGEKAS